jgi:hypothetical protein
MTGAELKSIRQSLGDVGAIIRPFGPIVIGGSFCGSPMKLVARLEERNHFAEPLWLSFILSRQQALLYHISYLFCSSL